MQTHHDTTDFGAFLGRFVDSDPELDDMVADAELHLVIAEEIYRLRTERGLTQTQLAKEIGSHQSSIARLEDADYSGHSLNILQRVARALGMRLHVGFYAKVVFRHEEGFSQNWTESVSDWPVVPTEVE